MSQLEIVINPEFNEEQVEEEVEETPDVQEKLADVPEEITEEQIEVVEIIEEPIKKKKYDHLQKSRDVCKQNRIRNKEDLELLQKIRENGYDVKYLSSNKFKIPTDEPKETPKEQPQELPVYKSTKRSGFRLNTSYTQPEPRNKFQW
jgi:hypothetical protein